MKNQFRGKSLIKVPEEVGFLQGDFGQEVLGEYNARVKEDYHSNKNLQVLSYINDTVTGSNPFAVALINKIIASDGLHVATQADLEKILKTQALVLQGTYEDSALAQEAKETQMAI